jgi:integrase/recombinase XerD
MLLKGDFIMGKLREQMKGDLELKGLSPHTQENYLRQVSQFARHYGRSPRQLGEKEIKEYLLYLIREKKSSTATVNLCYHALKFLYKTTLNREWVIARVPRLKSIKQLPCVLDKEEVESLFSVTKNIKHRAILMLIYSSGLRLMEAAHLKVSDIDSKRMLLRI